MHDSHRDRTRRNKSDWRLCDAQDRWNVDGSGALLLRKSVVSLWVLCSDVAIETHIAGICMLPLPIRGELREKLNSERTKEHAPVDDQHGVLAYGDHD